MVTTSLEIGSGTYTIEQVDANSVELLKLDGAIGLCKYMDKRILISDEGVDDTYYQTLWHEVIHAVAFEHGLPFVADEDIVDRLGAALYTLFKANNWAIPKELKRGKH